MNCYDADIRLVIISSRLRLRLRLSCGESEFMDCLSY